MKGLLERLFGADGTAHPVPAGFREDQVAAAALLVEAACSDGKFGETERQVIATSLARHFGLSASQAEDLLERAERTARDAVEWHGFTHAVKEATSPEERVDLIELLWEVVLADGKVHDYEASLIRRICGLLYVSGRESAEARNRARERLDLPPPEPL